MSGYGADRGYDYQADAIAYIAAHALAGQPLEWFDDESDIPGFWQIETGGAGDDVRVVTEKDLAIEVQAKHKLSKGEDYTAAFRRLAHGLSSDEKLRAVLLVDYHSSRNILSDLKNDIIRIGQGRSDSIKPITKDLLADLSQDGISEPHNLFSRLRIVAVGLDEGNDGAFAALALLAKVVHPKNSSTAFTLLGKRGHHLIKNRGQDSAYDCAKYLARKVGLSEGSTSPVVAVIEFANWVGGTNASFYCPAMQRTYPIRNAWAELVEMGSRSQAPKIENASVALSEQIRRYQEWYRLVDHHRGMAVSAEVFVQSNRLSVIVGGPGSGKSTIGKRLTHYFAGEALTVRVRLAGATLLKDGCTFESALVEAAVESSGCDPGAATRIVAHAKFLIADGLDECDPQRADVATGLASWAQGHPQTSICIMTRPVGHSPHLLPEFAHAELQPLGSLDIRRLAAWMIESQEPDPKVSSDVLDRFMQTFEEFDVDRSAKSLAARNPLLLSFMVRLFLDGASLDGKRLQLFTRIVELILKHPPLMRKGAQQGLDTITAWIAAETIGWNCIAAPNRPVEEMINLVAVRLGPGIEFRRQAAATVLLLTEHGLVEKLSVGSRDALVFVHPALGEFLAGRYLAQLEERDLMADLNRHTRQVKWREPILLAGAEVPAKVIPILLSLDEPNDPLSTEAMLAAGVLAECNDGEVQDAAVRSVVDCLTPRLRSFLPLVSIEAGIGLIELGPWIPDVLVSIGMDLWDHDQAWTRLAASCAALSTGSRLLPIDYVVSWVEKFSPVSLFMSSSDSDLPMLAAELQKAALPKALLRVAEELPAERARDLTRSAVTGEISFRLANTVTDVLSRAGFSELLPERESIFIQLDKFVSQQDLIRQGAENSAAGIENLMRTVLAVCGAPSKSPVNESQLPLLGSLFASARFWQLTPGHIGSLRHATSDAPLRVVLIGLIAGLGLDRSRLAQEASAWLSGPKGKETRYPPTGVKRDFNSRSVVGAGLDLRVLCDALSHPCHFLSLNAALLFELLGPGREQEQLLAKMLSGSDETVLYLVGSIAASIWPDGAFELLHDRIKVGNAEGCKHLYLPVFENARSEEQLARAASLALEAMSSENNRIASAAAEALRNQDLKHLVPTVNESSLRNLLDSWNDKVVFCEQCQQPVSGSSCDVCRISPPRLRHHLLFILSALGEQSISELIEFANDRDRDTSKEACEILGRRSISEGEALDQVLASLDGGKAPLGVLDEVLRQPVDRLRQVSSRIASAIASPRAAVRERIVRSLDAGWLEPETSRRLAEGALSDPSASVRSRAVEALRRISQT